MNNPLELSKELKSAKCHFEIRTRPVTGGGDHRPALAQLAQRGRAISMELVDVLLVGPFVLILLGVLAVQIWDTYETIKRRYAKKHD